MSSSEDYVNPFAAVMNSPRVKIMELWFRGDTPFRAFPLMDHLDEYNEIIRDLNREYREAVDRHAEASRYQWGRNDPVLLPSTTGTLESCRRIARYYKQFVNELSDADQVTLALLDESTVEGADD